MAQVFKLFRIQQIDSQIDQNQQQIKQNIHEINSLGEISTLRGQKDALEVKLHSKQSEMKKADA